MTAPISGFIFDLDGVITETSEFHYLAWKQLAEEENLPFTRHDNEQLRGVSRRESLLRLLKGRPVPEATMQIWMERKNAYYTQHLEKLSPQDCLPGVGEFLAEAEAMGIKLGIGSASKNAKPVLERLGLLHKFEVIGDGYSVAHTKPAPDLFIWVAGGLKIPVTEAVVFEDAEAGIEAAQAAGCFSVGLGTADVSRAQVVLPSLDGVSASELVAKLAAIHSTRG